METLKNLAWCAAFTVLVCAVVVSLLALGAYLDAAFQPEIKREKVLVCEDGKRGFYSCKTEYY